MDYEKIGALIRSLRTQQGLTQRELAQRLTVSDKAVSKWERGQGCPDVSLLPSLAQTLGVEVEGLLAGELLENEQIGGTMKNLNFYVCPTCGNILTSAVGAAVTCCGKKLAPLEAVKAPQCRAYRERLLRLLLPPHDQGALRLLRRPGNRRYPDPAAALPGVGPAEPPAPNRPREALLVLRPARPLLPAGVTGLSVVY